MSQQSGVLEIVAASSQGCRRGASDTAARSTPGRRWRRESTDPNVSNLTVLVLDDDPAARDLLTRFLALHGYQSTEAATMREAVDLIRCTHIGAVILDVRIPGGSGLLVLEHLRTHAEFATIPAIVLTGGLLTADEQVMVTRHRAHLFYKPEGFDSLVEFLTQLTGDDRPH